MCLSCCCLQGKSVACPVCQHSYPEHRLKYHIKSVHPGKEHTNISTHRQMHTPPVHVVHKMRFHFVCVCLHVCAGQTHHLCRVKVWWCSAQRSAPTATPTSWRTAVTSSGTSGPTKVWYFSTLNTDKHIHGARVWRNTSGPIRVHARYFTAWLSCDPSFHLSLFLLAAHQEDGLDWKHATDVVEGNRPVGQVTCEMLRTQTNKMWMLLALCQRNLAKNIGSSYRKVLRVFFFSFKHCSLLSLGLCKTCVFLGMWGETAKITARLIIHELLNLFNINLEEVLKKVNC